MPIDVPSTSAQGFPSPGTSNPNPRQICRTKTTLEGNRADQGVSFTGGEDHSGIQTMEHNLRCRTKTKRSSHCHGEPMFKKSRLNLQFLNFPLDVQQLILSKLPLKEVTRTSVLSSKWQTIPTVYPKLRFDGITMCSRRNIPGSEQYIKEFIQNVDAVLQQHNGEFVESFELKFEFDNQLIIHLDEWVSGFPNLRKLDLHLIDSTAKDLGDMLSSCSNLEWLSIVRMTRIKFNAMKLQTFVWGGGNPYPFDLSQSLMLKDAHFYVYGSITLEYALVTLPTVIPSVEHLTLQATAPLKTLALLENSCKLSQLKYLQLDLFMNNDDADNILSLSSYLRAAPLLEKFELHFSITAFTHSDRKPLRSLPRHPHNRLKNLYITGFTACTGHLEFLLHIVENAPFLEVLTLDPACIFDRGMTFEGQESIFSWVREVSRRYLAGRISSSTKLCLL
ncbi:hypothetical protein QOZ80_6BG0464650 [Eleusine coracana subsp. coracana]|nr:hypothetical protein QOZ80_6BG0464650 [Eleusine coracana subsp. coracana]